MKKFTKNTEKLRYRDTKAVFFSIPKISSSHSGEDVTDFSTREKEENWIQTYTYIVLRTFLRVLLRTVPKPFAFGA